MPPRVLLIHGSAADRSTWSIQLAGPLKDAFALIAYDRRADASTVEAHADDAIAQLGDDPTPAIVIGSSFGAVIALDAVRRYPARFAGAVLIEPPMAASDEAPAAPTEFLARLDRAAETAGGPAAAELFLRMVLGDTGFERMPRAYQDRSKAMWAEIRADSQALITYRPRYAELSTVTTPVQLLGGERSPAYFRPTLDALSAALPDARLELIAGAGHMLHAAAHRRFTEVVLAFAASLA
ncbi:MAG: alpha/beta hydrolase [Myxococcales bacterium]|nr:alpha/beta hydrolase [Myxococcales bacterium]